MPSKNDYVNYSTRGICKIEDIRPMRFHPDSPEKDYYVLTPIHQEHSHIFIATDNQDLIDKMRPLLTPEEVDRAILSVKDHSMPWIKDRKQRTARFQEILSKRDERELLLLTSCLYLQSRENTKGLSASDTQTLKKAESIIEQEFSFSLKLHASSIDGYIRKKLNVSTDIE